MIITIIDKKFSVKQIIDLLKKNFGNDNFSKGYKLHEDEWKKADDILKQIQDSNR